jgi:hypothetical protein
MPILLIIVLMLIGFFTFVTLYESGHKNSSIICLILLGSLVVWAFIALILPWNNYWYDGECEPVTIIDNNGHTTQVIVLNGIPLNVNKLMGQYIPEGKKIVVKHNNGWVAGIFINEEYVYQIK